MQTRNHILALVAAAALLSTTSAMAQTEGKLFEGASTYFLEILTETKCGLTKDFIRKKAMFPLSYSNLTEGDKSSSDIWITLNVTATKLSRSEKCFGVVNLTVDALLWSRQIPFNKKSHYAKIPLFAQHKIFANGAASDIGGVVEDSMKELVTTINMDNK